MAIRFVQRNAQNKVVADYACRQLGYAEEEMDSANPELLASRLPPPPTTDELETEVQLLLNGGSGPHIDHFKLLKAKFVSDLAWRLGVAPAALTGTQLTAERNRIAAIYKAL